MFELTACVPLRVYSRSAVADPKATLSCSQTHSSDYSRVLRDRRDSFRPLQVSVSPGVRSPILARTASQPAIESSIEQSRLCAPPKTLALGIFPRAFCLRDIMEP